MVGGGFKLLLHKCDKVILWGGKLAVEWKWSGKRKNPLFGRIGVYNLCLNHASSPLHWRQILGQSGQTDLTLTRCLSKISASHIMNEIIGKFGKQSWTSEGTFQCRFTQSLHFPEHHHDVNLEFFATPMFMRNLRHFSHDEPPASNPQICSSIPLCSFTSDTKLVQIVKNITIPFSVRTIKQTWGRKLWIWELGKIENDEVEVRRCKPKQCPQSRKLEIQESTEDYEVELW